MVLVLEHNLNEGVQPADFQISITTSQIEIIARKSHFTLVKLMTLNNDLVNMDFTMSEGQAIIPLYIADVVAGTALSRVALSGNFKLQIKSWMHGEQITEEFVVTITA